MVRNFVWLSVAFLTGAVAVYGFAPDNTIVYPDVIVPARVIIEREPEVIRTFVDRVVYVEAKPTQIATATDGAKSLVVDFCRPLVLADQVETTPDSPGNPSLLLRSVTYNRKWAWKKDELLLTGPLNNGDLHAMDYEVRGDWTARTVGSGSLVQHSRTSLFYDFWEGGSQIFTLFKLGEALLSAF